MFPRIAEGSRAGRPGPRGTISKRRRTGGRPVSGQAKGSVDEVSELKR
jgi:hypothetical protein